MVALGVKNKQGRKDRKGSTEIADQLRDRPLETFKTHQPNSLPKGSEILSLRPSYYQKFPNNSSFDLNLNFLCP